MAAYERVCRDKSLLTSTKKKAKGKEKQELTRKIGGLELVHHLLLMRNTDSIVGLIRRSTLPCMFL